MGKVNVSLPDGLLAAVDALAHEFNRSRSGIVAEATERYVAEAHAQRAARERETRVRTAMASAREIAKKVPPGPPVEEIIRRDRDTDRGRLQRPEDFT
ncbi:MAG: hypothetical protein HGB10_01710 [Coriobacteriia bacterium]|nr:hypothetical protein [Coriobacteriia bacterium]